MSRISYHCNSTRQKTELVPRFRARYFRDNQEFWQTLEDAKSYEVVTSIYVDVTDPSYGRPSSPESAGLNSEGNPYSGFRGIFNGAIFLKSRNTKKQETRPKIRLQMRSCVSPEEALSILSKLEYEYRDQLDDESFNMGYYYNNSPYHYKGSIINIDLPFQTESEAEQIPISVLQKVIWKCEKDILALNLELERRLNWGAETSGTNTPPRF
jgi:hypothetical protein